MDDAKVIEGSIPEPFIGNPLTARVVLLGLNPGHSLEDERNHQNIIFREAMRKNLCHEKDCHFYPLSKAFERIGAAKWWGDRTRELREATGLDELTFAERLLVIEWFPYHSKRSGLRTKPICESQKYSFQLAKEMLGKKLVIRMRSKRHWEKVDQRFGQVPSLKNPQCGFITRRNTELGLFDEIVKVLQAKS